MSSEHLTVLSVRPQTRTKLYINWELALILKQTQSNGEWLTNQSP